ncbi:HAD family hydrolase [Dyella dinghuensis]|uniref:HAD family hydrolase n=1 Tax=Dyella dinghuensis TaxID=1920169 RepID=A0A432LTG9_9GAMM|nr:HAD-IA family hydrolase [Dyella dinghuensis]RUL64275.1 HAD family hydrolase [Dyella dinghuensis]
MKHALVLSGGGFQGLALVRSLQQLHDVKVIVCDIFPDNLTRYVCADYLLAPPLSDTNTFSSFLMETVSRKNIDVIFPATARELSILSQLKDELRERGVHVAACDQGLLTTLLDKQQAYTWMHQQELPAQTLHDATDFNFSQALFGRPRNGWGGQGTHVLRNAGDIVAHIDDPKAYIWTLWLPSFEEFSADFAIDIHGRISPIVLRKRIRVSGGFAVISDSVSNHALEDLAGRVAQTLSTHGGGGLFNIQILVPKEGEPFISDINPRMGTSATHGLAEGINLPGFFMASVRNDVDAHVTPQRKMVRTVRLLEDLVVPHLARKPRGIVFDLDDTLVDHKLWMFEKIKALYLALFQHRTNRESFFRCAAGLIDEGVRSDLIDRLLAELALPTTFREETIEAYRAAVVPNTPLFDDVESILKALKAEGFKLAVLTDNPPATQKSKIRHALPLNALDTVIYAREHGKEKPDPTGFLKVAQALDIEPADLVMVGDNYFRDGEGAVAAGYAHSFVIQRAGTFLNHSQSLSERLGIQTEPRISLVNSLLTVHHACTAS